MRALIVEDDRNIRELLRIRLSREGWDVLEAGDGRAGVAAFERSTSEGRAVNLVLLDYMLPFFNGDEVAARIRRVAEETGAQVPYFVALTGAKDAQVFTDFEVAGVTEIHVKGGDIANLDRLCKRISGEPAAA